MYARDEQEPEKKRDEQSKSLILEICGHDELAFSVVLETPRLHWLLAF